MTILVFVVRAVNYHISSEVSELLTVQNTERVLRSINKLLLKSAESGINIPEISLSLEQTAC